MIRLALPKGSLQADTLAFLRRAGYAVDGYEEGARGYRPALSDDDIAAKTSRPQEIPMYVDEGIYDAGISGLDWLRETVGKRDAEDALDLGYGRVQIVLAAHESLGDVRSLSDLIRQVLQTRDEVRIATEYRNLTCDHVLRATGVEPSVRSPWERGTRRHTHSHVVVMQSFGATEGKPPDDADAIVDNTETGRTLSANGLRVVEYVQRDSTARLIVNRLAREHPVKGPIIERLIQRLALARPEPANAARARTATWHI